MTGPRLEIEQQGYTRYNRSFLPKSHYTIEQRRTGEDIDHGNHHIATKVLRAKPSIGTVQGWNRNFEANREIRSNISKYTQRGASKGALDVYEGSRFMPEHYRSFINQNEAREGREGREGWEGREGREVHVRAEQLFQLPKLRQLRGSMTRIGDDGKAVECL